MAAKTVVVGCKLPHGIVLEHPMDTTKKVEIAGINKSAILGATHGITEVDGDFWEQWSAVHKEFPALKSGAIFVAKSVADAAAIARETADVKTGLEPMRTDGKDERATGVIPADKE